MEPHEKLKVLARDFGVSKISSVVLDDPRFPLWSGSSKINQHHYGKGGLAQHTLEVVELCLQNNSFFPAYKQSNVQQLFLAGLFHDSGKMWDYVPTGGPLESMLYDHWAGTHHKRNIHHISRSAILWDTAHRDNPVGDHLFSDEVLHAILAHHGLREWGSPVSPNTRLAWLLHLCDGISARMDDVGFVHK